MLRRAWILPLLMLVAICLAALVPARAAADDAFRRNAPPAFTDLPGVVPEQERVRRDSYTCTTTIENVYVGRGRYDILFGDTAPRRVYTCKTESGVSYRGTRPPSRHWVPGLNPLHLPD